MNRGNGSSANHDDVGGPVGEFPTVENLPSAGQLLRQAREAAGLHIAALAVSLKIPVKKLEALEADRYDLLPDAVFARALASSVCRTLKVDGAEVLSRLPVHDAPSLRPRGAVLNTPFRAANDGPGPTTWTQLSRPAVLGGLALVIAALVVVLFPSIKNGSTEGSTGAVSSGVKEQIFGPASSTASAGGDVVSGAQNVVVSNPTPSLSSMAPDQPSAAASGTAGRNPLSSGTPVARDISVAVPAAHSGPIGAATADSSGGILVISAKSPSWVKVTDAKGVVVLQRTLSAGEVVHANGALPLIAVVGRADVTLVHVRGKAFDLSAFSKDNVARFGVK